MAEIKAVVFDFDGVIINSLKVHFRTFQAIAKAFDKQTFPTIKEHAVKWPGWKLMFAQWGLEGEDFKKAHQMYIDKYNEMEKEIDFYPEIKTVLKKLKKKGIKTAIATNNQRAVLEKNLEKYGIKELVDDAVTAEEITKMKPDPEIVLKCLEKLGVKPENAVYVGDMDFDVLAGKNAGTKTVAVTYGWHPKEMLEKAKPDLIVNKPIDILKILGGKK